MLRLRTPALRRTALASAVVASLTLTGCSATPLLGTGPTTTGTATPTPAPAIAPTAVAIGDSIAIGNGVPAENAWPLLVAQRFGWNLTDLGESASGFTVPGLNTHTFDDQVTAAIRLRPQVVVIAATRNDVFAETNALKIAMTAALNRITTALPDATIIGVGPIWGGEQAPEQISVIAATMKTVVTATGGHWVEIGQPFTGRSDLLLTDNVHPTVAGQKLLATMVANRIQILHLRIGEGD